MSNVQLPSDGSRSSGETAQRLLAIAAPSTQTITLPADARFDASAATPDIAAFRAELEEPWLVAQHACNCPDTATPDNPESWCEACQTQTIPADAGSAPLPGPTDSVAPAATTIGLLMRGLLVRYFGGAAPVTVQGSGNSNVQQAVDAFLAAADDAVPEHPAPVDGGPDEAKSSPEMVGFRRWLASSVAGL